MGFANIAPVLMRNVFPALAIPIDRFVGRRGLFGSHKTLRGIMVAVLFGVVGFWWQQLVSMTDAGYRLGLFDYHAMTLWFGFFAGFGAIVGDLFRSALKRRVGIRPGGKFIPFDQIDYIIGGILFTLPWYQPTIEIVLISLVVGFLLHVAISSLGYALGMKKDRF